MKRDAYDTFGTVPHARVRGEILRLRRGGLTDGEIGDAVGLARNTISDYASPYYPHSTVRLSLLTKLKAIPTPVHIDEPDPLAWQADAACKGVDVAIFYPEVERNANGDRSPMWSRPKAICDTCDVRQACLDHALAAPERHGMWGGMTANQRRLLLRRRRDMRRSA